MRLILELPPVFCPIWLKFGTLVNFGALISNLNKKIDIRTIWARKRLRKPVKFAKHCLTNAFVNCWLRTISNDALYDYACKSQKISFAHHEPFKHCKNLWGAFSTTPSPNRINESFTGTPSFTAFFLASVVPWRSCSCLNVDCRYKH